MIKPDPSHPVRNEKELDTEGIRQSKAHSGKLVAMVGFGFIGFARYERPLRLSDISESQAKYPYYYEDGEKKKLPDAFMQRWKIYDQNRGLNSTSD